MMKPINSHVLIQPLIQQRGIALTSKETFEEIGVVIDFDADLAAPQTVFSNNSISSTNGTPMEVNVPFLQKGCKVFFDAWLAAKYPNPEKQGEYFWLVKYEDIRAIEHAEQSLPSKQ